MLNFTSIKSLLIGFALLSMTSAVAQDAPRDAIRFDDNGEFNPTIIVAKHSLIWNGHVVTWNRIVEEFRAERPNGAFQATFYFTGGVHRSKEGWQPRKDKIMAVYSEFFEPLGVTYASVMPRGGRYWDSIRSQEDLDSSHAKKWRVIDANGKPANQAQVVVIPSKEPLSILSVSLKNGRIENPVHEQMVLTDSSGRFGFQKFDDEFFVVAMHASGFGITKVSETDDDAPQKTEITLRAWATLTVSAENPSDQKISFETRPEGIATRYPSFSTGKIVPGKEPITIRIPSGTTVVRSSFKIGDSWFGIPTQSLTLKPNDVKNISIPEPGQRDRQRAEQLKRHSERNTEKKLGCIDDLVDN